MSRSKGITWIKDFFHSRTVHLDIINFFYLPTDAQESCFKKNIKINIKRAPTYFGALTIIRSLLVYVCTHIH